MTKNNIIKFGKTMLLIKWKLLSSLNFISLASLSSPLSLSLAYRWNLKSSYGVLTRKIRGIIVTINLWLLLGAPNIFAGAPATWVKWLKCHSPFHIKNARTSHCSFSTFARCFFFLFSSSFELLLLPLFRAWWLVVRGYWLRLFFLLWWFRLVDRLRG